MPYIRSRWRWWLSLFLWRFYFLTFRFLLTVFFTFKVKRLDALLVISPLQNYNAIIASWAFVFLCHIVLLPDKAAWLLFLGDTTLQLHISCFWSHPTKLASIWSLWLYWCAGLCVFLLYPRYYLIDESTYYLFMQNLHSVALRPATLLLLSEQMVDLCSWLQLWTRPEWVFCYLHAGIIPAKVEPWGAYWNLAEFRRAWVLKLHVSFY